MRGLLVLLTVAALVTTGCAAAPKPVSPPTVDISGKWRGIWRGFGIEDAPRKDEVTAELTQQGSRGSGRIVMSGTLAAESIPEVVRLDGAWGSQVEFEVSGNEVVMREAVDGRVFTLDLRVEGDRMVGSMRDTSWPVTLELWRVRAPAPVASAPPPTPPPAPAPAPAAPAPVAPEAPKPPAPVAPAPPAAPARPAPRDFAQIPELKPVYFDFDKYDIRPADAEILRANAEWLKARPEMGVLIQGHADERGTEEYNLALGERRARSARNFLVSQGVAADRIAILSFGEERPVCTEKTEACWSRNRRADFLVKPR